VLQLNNKEVTIPNGTVIMTSHCIISDYYH